jgi:hypothetical protein
LVGQRWPVRLGDRGGGADGLGQRGGGAFEVVVDAGQGAPLGLGGQRPGRHALVAEEGDGFAHPEQDRHLDLGQGAEQRLGEVRQLAEGRQVTTDLDSGGPGEVHGAAGGSPDPPQRTQGLLAQAGSAGDDRRPRAAQRGGGRTHGLVGDRSTAFG